MSNKKSNDFIENTLISLKRQYSTNETISALSRYLKKYKNKNTYLQQENHVLKNEVSLLKIKLIDAEKYNNHTNRDARVMARKEDLYLIQLDKNKKILKMCNDFRRSRDVLLFELNKLKGKC